MKSISFSAKGEKPKVTREQALRVARQLGCRGAHEAPNGSWLPCGSQTAFDAIQKGKEEYLRATAKEKADIIPAITRRVEKLYTKSNAYFENRSDAEEISRRNGCMGVRIVILGGNKYYAPCTPKPKFENLREGGIVGINTLTDGSLTSAPIAGKDEDITEIDAKGFVNFVSRSTDPDVFSDPDSARIRARNLGCIGVRRYTARDGETVWLPCSNGSDYNRTMGIGGDNKPRRRGSNVGKKSASLAKTPAKKKERIFGSLRNAKRSASSLSSAKEIDLDAQTVNSLAVKVREHNAKMSEAKKDAWSKTNLRALKAVYRRGAGAFSTSHRPGMNRNQWAMGRVNAFLKMLSSGKPDSPKYRNDNDLLPKDHPWRKEKPTAKKDLDTTDGVYGIKTAGGCCPKQVIRYYKL